MSFSNPRQVNPATKFIEWSGEKGQFYYYDKEKKDKVFMQLPIYFIVLDELSCVKGFHERSNSGIGSNEVRNTLNEILHVKSWRNGISEKGLWQDIKEKVTSAGAKYTKSVYAILLTKEGTELVNFQFHGSSFGGASQEKGVRSGWINAKFNKEQYGVQVKSTEAGQKGKTEFICPVFEQVNIKQHHIELAQKADFKLQQYLDYYLNKPIDEKGVEVKESPEDFEADKYNLPPSENISDAVVVNEPTDDLPF